MSLTTEQLANGLTLDHELFFPTKPEDPGMRESTSIWLVEENGEFAFPRIGIEGEAWSWEDRLYHANFALGGGRVLSDVNRAQAPSPIGPDGKPSQFGAGGLLFRCIEPFRRWLVTYDGTAAEGTFAQQTTASLDSSKRTPLSFEVELEMVTPGWVHDFPAEKVAQMSKAEARDASTIGIGWRIEHLFRATGNLRIDGTDRAFKAVGSRIKRQSVRATAANYGHCWQSAVFPDGSAFGYIAYPASAKEPEPYNQGYVYSGGRMYPARAVKSPWLQSFVDSGQDVSLEIESELGAARIKGTTTVSTCRPYDESLSAENFNLNLQQAAVRYEWDGQTSYGMLERSATQAQWQERNAAATVTA